MPEVYTVTLNVAMQNLTELILVLISMGLQAAIIKFSRETQ